MTKLPPNRWTKVNLQRLGTVLVVLVGFIVLCGQLTGPFGSGLNVFGFQIHGPGRALIEIQLKHEADVKALRDEITHLEALAQERMRVTVLVVEGYQQLRQQIGEQRSRELDDWIRERKR